MDFGVSVGVSAIALLKDVIKHLKEKKEKDPELLSTLNDVMGEVLNLRESVLDLIQRNHQLEEKLKSAEAAAQEEKSVVWDEHRGIWVDKENPGQGGYCPKCKLRHNKLVPLMVEPNGWRCTACAAFVDNQDWVPTVI